MIVVNGCPKHGNHALLKSVELLGQDAGSIIHYAHGTQFPEGTKHLFIYRDPRNGLISWMRQQGKSITDGTVMAAIREGTYLRYLRDFSGWMTDDTAFKVRFESLIADDVSIRDIAFFLDVPFLDSAFKNLTGMTITWTGELSDFRTFWTPMVAAVWAH